MQELEFMHALKKGNGIIFASQVQILILDSLKSEVLDFFDPADKFKLSFKLTLRFLKF